MRFLLDENVSFRVGIELADQGHDAVHVDDLSMGEASHPEILERARDDGRVIISADADFGAYLAADRATEPSVILIREVSNLPSWELARLLLANLGDLSSAGQPNTGRHQTSRRIGEAAGQPDRAAPDDTGRHHSPRAHDPEVAGSDPAPVTSQNG